MTTFPSPESILAASTSSVAALLAALLVGALAGAATTWWALGRRPTAADPAEALQPMLAPLDEALRQLHGLALQVDESERRRAQAHGELRAYAELMGRSSEQLRRETTQLVTALRAPQVRGRWGEVQLRRVVELAGLVEHCDFEEQPTFRGEDGVQRPDLVVQLAGERHIVVDAKVSFAGYLDALAAQTAGDADEAESRMQAHARHLRTHVDQLADKAYWQAVAGSPEFVVMFVPAEPFLSAALDVDPGLLEHAFSRNVVVATPSTLLALLRTVAWGWRQESLADDAAQVHATGRELYTRLRSFAGHLGRVGGALESAVGAYNQAIGSWENRVLVTARRLDELNVGDGSLPDATVVDLGVRPLRDTSTQVS
jgi:DNA recombination protein RmuC